MTSTMVLVSAGAAGLLMLGLLFFLARRGPRCDECGARVRVADFACGRCGFAPPSVPAFLEFLSGPMTGKSLQLPEEGATVGSVAGNTVILSDPAISRQHAEIRQIGRQYWMRDAGSTNGIYHNGRRTPEAALRDRDRLRMGNSEMRFRLGRLARTTGPSGGN